MMNDIEKPPTNDEHLAKCLIEYPKMVALLKKLVEHTSILEHQQILQRTRMYLKTIGE
jgi:hypothetical protein